MTHPLVNLISTYSEHSAPQSKTVGWEVGKARMVGCKFGSTWMHLQVHTHQHKAIRSMDSPWQMTWPTQYNNFQKLTSENGQLLIAWQPIQTYCFKEAQRTWKEHRQGTQGSQENNVWTKWELQQKNTNHFFKNPEITELKNTTNEIKNATGNFDSKENNLRGRRQVISTHLVSEKQKGTTEKRRKAYRTYGTPQASQHKHHRGSRGDKKEKAAESLCK